MFSAEDFEFHGDFGKIPLPIFFKNYNIFGMISKILCAEDLIEHGEN
jgi:hypothetical protein